MTRVRRFHLYRLVDESGMSGTGRVAEGVELPNGMCVMWWLKPPHSVQQYRSIEDLEHIHGHGEKRTTEVLWEDEGSDAWMARAEPRLHTGITDGLPERHPLRHENVECQRCGDAVHASYNECLKAWVETGRGPYCWECFVQAFPSEEVLGESDWALEERGAGG